jgi:hypothetical protein
MAREGDGQLKKNLSNQNNEVAKMEKPSDVPNFRSNHL